MTRAYNFSAGPAMLPGAVIERIRGDLPEYHGTGSSVMEISHRSEYFQEIAAGAEDSLRELLGIGNDYKVLFLHGGAQMQFLMAPMNLLGERQVADYVITGTWGRKAHSQAARIARLNVAADAKASSYTAIPPQSQWRLSENAGYLHFTPNETITGVEFHHMPQGIGAPLVADMSSTFLSRPIDVNKFGMIYAGAQKNIGPAGLCVVVIKDHLLRRCRDDLPALLSYRSQAEHGSMVNTPNTFAWYVAGLVLEWIKEQGGLQRMGEINSEKAKLLYDCIDGSDFYHNPVHKDVRSWMNVPFTLSAPDLDQAFLDQAGKNGLVALQGHRSVGGMRASIYNAMPLEGVKALAAFMRDFENRMG